MNNDIKEQINEIIAEVLEIDVEDTHLFDREQNTKWDSLKHLEIIMAVEEEFDIRFSATEVTEVKNVVDLYNFVSEKLS